VLLDGVIDEDEGVVPPPPARVGGLVQPEDWKYSHVGTESAAAPSAPQ